MKYDVEKICEFYEYQMKTFYNLELNVDNYIGDVIGNLQNCFIHSSNKYCRDDMEFSVFNTVQYSMFLYFLSKQFDNHNMGRAADATYCLNKMLFSVDLYYKIELPSIFMMEHPLGTVMGRAKYGDYFMFYQGCTVGGNNNVYPQIGNHVLMFSNSKVLGKSSIGNHVVLSANSYVIDTDIPDNSIVFGQSPNLVIKGRSEDEMNQFFCRFWNI